MISTFIYKVNNMLLERKSLKMPSSANDNSRKVQIRDIVILKEDGTARGFGS